MDQELLDRLDRLEQENTQFKNVLKQLGDKAFMQKHSSKWGGDEEIGSALLEKLKEQKYDPKDEEEVVNTTLKELKSYFSDIAEKIQLAEELIEDQLPPEEGLEPEPAPDGNAEIAGGEEAAMAEEAGATTEEAGEAAQAEEAAVEEADGNAEGTEPPAELPPEEAGLKSGGKAELSDRDIILNQLKKFNY
jgi:hypothetical protein